MTLAQLVLATILIWVAGAFAAGCTNQSNIETAKDNLAAAMVEYQAIVGNPASSPEAVAAAKAKMKAAMQEVVNAGTTGFINSPVGGLVQDLVVVGAGLFGLNKYRTGTRQKQLAEVKAEA